jgi:DNA repair exonuclease SbcCD ATPase subunit
MNIELKKLKLRNFKGIRAMEIDFSEVTDIFGENATGKTSILDGFMWLLFGKDSQDRQDFNIKTLDENNQPYHHLDHEVEAHLIVDGEPIVLRRTLKENWVKKRGEMHQEFSGHTTTFFWNEVPMQKGEFEGKISAIIDPALFKLLTNVQYFNSIKWQDRREILIKIAGEVNNEEVLNQLTASGNATQFKALVAALQQNKTLDEFKREVASKKKTIREQLTLLPSRIDEATRSLPDNADWKQLEDSLREKTEQLAKIDAELGSHSAMIAASQDRLKAKMRTQNELEARCLEIEYSYRNIERNKITDQQVLLSNLKRELNTVTMEKKELLSRIADQRNKKLAAEKSIAEIDAKLAELRFKWHDLNESQITFNEEEFKCPTCKREYDTYDVNSKKDELQANFNKTKAEKLEVITKKGQELKNEKVYYQTILNNISNDENNGDALVKQCDVQIDAIMAKMPQIEESISRSMQSVDTIVNAALKESIEYQECLQSIAFIKTEIEQLSDTPVDNTALLSIKNQINAEIIEIKTQLNTRELRQRTLDRIQELKASERQMSAELADLEGIEFSIEEFTVAKMNALEERINAMFKYVTFKLFQEQINGGRTETCETLVKGVPYSDANTASKINAGLDIINTLAAHYRIHAPIWIDNAESVNQLLAVESQIIRLVVSKDKKLKINNNSAKKTAQPATNNA